MARHLVVIDRYVMPHAERVIAICPDCPAGHARFRRWSRLPAEAWSCTFDQLAAYPHQQPAYAAAMQFVQEPRGWLSFAGGYGAGKTTLIYAVLHALAMRGMYGAYWTAPDLVEKLRASELRDDLGRAHSDDWARLAALPVLAIDEIDKYRETAFAEEAIFRLFNQRYQLRQTHATLIGYNQDGANRIPPFLRSRIGDGRFRLVEVPSIDLRPLLGGMP